jgi:hypothetical protein
MKTGRRTTGKAANASSRKDLRRLEFIEFRLYWEGRVNRKDLTRFFHISTPQATLDLKRYHALAPGNMDYDLSKKAYVAARRFTPRLVSPDAGMYLAQLKLLAEGALDQRETFFGQIPAFELVPELNRPVETETLRRVVHALQSRCRIRIRYQSLTSPEPTERWVFPCTLAYNGSRWHLRAFCHLRSAYRDFVIGKILEVIGEAEETTAIPEDLNWMQTVSVQIGASKTLAKDQTMAVEHDYGMADGKCEVSVRRSLLQYFLEANGLAAPFKCSRYQDSQAVEVLNRGEVQRELEVRDANRMG